MSKQSGVELHTRRTDVEIREGSIGGTVTPTDIPTPAKPPANGDAVNFVTGQPVQKPSAQDA